MGESCSFADDAAELNDRSEQFHKIAGQILQQVMECGSLIHDYCKDTSFGKSEYRTSPLLPNVVLIPPSQPHDW